MKRFGPWLFFAALGASAQASQIVLAREFLSVFEGTELAIAFQLGLWLLGAAAGAAVGGRLRSGLLVLAAAAALAAPLAGLAAREIRTILHTPPGASLSLTPLALSTAALVAPVAGLFGALFALGARATGRPSAGYAVEAAGAAVAGILLSLWLLRAVDPVSLGVGAGTLLLIGACPLVGRRAVGFALLSLFALLAAPGLDRRSRERSWRRDLPGFALVEAAESPYGPVAALARGGETSLFLSGKLAMTLPDRGEARPLAVLAMLQNPRTRRVLLVGSACDGTLREILRFPVERVDVVEWDPVVAELARRFGDSSSLRDPRVRTWEGDGRRFIQRVRVRYDLVLIRVPDPTTAALNRYFTREFLRAARDRLTHGGTLVLGALAATSQAATEETLRRNRIVYRTVARAFRVVRVVPGSAQFFIASDDPSHATLEETTVFRRLSAAGVEDADLSWFVEPNAVERAKFEAEAGVPWNPIDPSPPSRLEVPPNTDERPAAGWISAVLWPELAGDPLAGPLRRISAVPWWAFLLGACLLGTAIPILGGRRRGVGWAVATVGLFGMALEGILLLSFQNRFGSLYQGLGLMFGLFMLGLAIGAEVARRFPARPRLKLRLLSLAAAVLAAALPPLLSRLPAAWSDPALAAALGGSALIVSLLVGAAFPWAVAALGPGRAGGLYAADVAGGAAGALLLLAILAPLHGLAAAGALVGLLCLSGAASIRS